MDILNRIDELRNERGWTKYDLTSRSGLSEYTIYSWYKRGSKPTLYALEGVCEAFDISMAEFFSEGKLDSLTVEQYRLLKNWEELSSRQRNILLDLIRDMVDLNKKLN